MKFSYGAKVRIMRLLDRYSPPSLIGRTGEVRGVSPHGYHVVLDDDGAEVTLLEAGGWLGVRNREG